MVFLWGALEVLGWVLLVEGEQKGCPFVFFILSLALSCIYYCCDTSLCLTVHTCHVCQWILFMWWGRREGGNTHCTFIHYITHLPLNGHIAWITINLSAHMDVHAPPPSSSSPLSMPSRLFFSQISLLPCFCQTVGNKNAVSSSLFLTFQRHGKFPTKEEEKKKQLLLKSTPECLCCRWQICLCWMGISCFCKPVNHKWTAPPDNLFRYMGGRGALKLN